MKEIKRLYVMQRIAEKQMTGPQGAELLGISLRQIRRLIAKYREGGAPGLVHGNRGRAPNNRIAEAWRARIWELAQGEYQDYNDSHFTEELAEEHGLKVFRSTVRRLDNAQTLWLPLHVFSEIALTSLPLKDFAPGPALVTVFVNGIPSESQIIRVN